MGNGKKRGPEGITLRPGPKITHGGYSYIRTGKIPKDRQEIERYLTWVRQTYIEDIAGTEDKLTAGQTVLLNKLILLEGLCRCIEYQAAKTESLGMPQKYLSYMNNIIKICSLLGIERKELIGDITPAEQAEIIKAEIRNND
jgi:hypothetical protein